jgi:protein-S-isoprenylcysteine O-methyltransferase Ste14
VQVGVILSMKQQKGGTGTSRSVFNGLLQIGIFIAVLAAAFFLCAGRINIIMGWVYFGLVLVNTGIISLMIDPGLIAERSEIRKNTKRWDILPAFLIGRVGPFGILIVAGLDVRFGWLPQVSLVLQIAAFGVALLGLVVADWAVVSNRFFSGVVRIQKDRGHTVVDNGPYRYVRHPGYVGAILHNIAMPVILSSLWGLLPAGFVVCVTIIRTELEDRTLQEELDGYASYAKRVRYRLLPAIW